MSRLVGQMGMWNAALADRDYDWSVEEHETVDSLRARLAEEGPTYLAHVREVVDQGRLDDTFVDALCEPAGGLHLRRDDRARADLRGPPAHAGGAGPRQARRPRRWAGATRCAGWPTTPRPDEPAPGRPLLNGRVHLALSLVALAAVVVVVAGFCRRYDLPAPLVLVALGAAGSFLPFVPEVHLTAEVVLVGLLPPLLYSAALQTSLVDFNANRRAILLLSIGLVAFTTAGVAVVVHYVIPAISWPAAFALGAVVAPPDAVSATAIARRIGHARAGSSRSSRASRCSTTRPRWWRCAPPSPLGGAAAR